jgi:hypothetical protein
MLLLLLLLPFLLCQVITHQLLMQWCRQGLDSYARQLHTCPDDPLLLLLLLSLLLRQVMIPQLLVQWSSQACRASRRLHDAAAHLH